MDVWLIRSNCDTTHNNPSDLTRYVPGEPPEYPKTKHDHREKCLHDGFARIGWPNTGDLRQPGLGRLCPDAYSYDSLAIDEPNHWAYLNDFRLIRTGDLVLIPAGTEQYDVHLGIVVMRDRISREITSRDPGVKAYDYYHDFPNGQWYECAHRVDVLWAEDGPESPFRVCHIEGITWRRAFSAVITARGDVIKLARKAGLLDAG